MVTRTGTAGNNNFIIIDPGVYIIDGLGGVDTVDFGTEPSFRYSISQGTDGSVHVDSISSASSALSATLINFEILKFRDQQIDLRVFFGDSAPPTVVSFNPADEATSVAVGANIVVTFSETIVRGSANIVLKTTAGQVVETFAPTSPLLTVSGSTLTINPTADLSYSTGYVLEFAAGSVKDASTNANPYAGTTTYNFTTAARVNTLPTGQVTVAGTVSQGQTLTAANTLADLDGIPTSGAGAISYQWKADGSIISGATGPTLTLTQAQVSKAISVVASYTDSFGTAESMASGATAAIANVNDLPTGLVTISGIATQGQTLTAAITLADLDGLGPLSYQWLMGGTAIAGATRASLALGQAQVGKVISLVANYVDGFGKAEQVSSTALPTVENLNDLPRGYLAIQRQVLTGQTLTVLQTLTDADGMGPISYQWKANGSEISGATDTSLAVTGALVAQTITVTASYTDGQGTAESVTGILGATLQTQAYGWKSHLLLPDVSVSLLFGTHSGSTDGAGALSLPGLSGTQIALSADRSVSAAEASATASAVNLQDAIAILKMIVGLPVNAANQPLSPYQTLAADFDGNGTVGLNDAIGILKHVVGLDAPAPTWRFLNELDATVPAKAGTLTPGAPATSLTADLTNGHLGLVAYLTGDVDGSYAGPAGAVSLDTQDPLYFVDLVAAHPEVSATQFGIYGGP